MELGENIMPEVTAEWARKESSEILSDKVSKQLTLCLESIKAAIKRDDKSANVTIYIHEKVETILRGRGFKVVQNPGYDQRDPAYITITW